MKTYAGIGSRRAPTDMIQLAGMLAEAFRHHGWTLRSGHAPGMDRAFEGGAYRQAEVYLPWPSFERSEPIEADVIVDKPSIAAMLTVTEYHPRGYSLKASTRTLMARNAHQILGRELDDPVSFVVCWTPDGSLDGEGPDTGGTGQALRIATHHHVPVFNLARADHLERLENYALSVVL